MTYLDDKLAIGTLTLTIKDWLSQLADPELPEAQYWRTMSYLLSHAALTGNIELHRMVDNVKRTRTGKPFPHVVTTPQNLPASAQESREQQDNPKAPMINLRKMLEDPWFATCCTDRQRYATTKWVEPFLSALMKEHGLYLAKHWKERPDVIRGAVAGALHEAGVLKGKLTEIARAYCKTEKRTTESDSFANYMGLRRAQRQPFFDFILEYVAKEAEAGPHAPA